MSGLDPDGIMSNHESHSSTGCGWERYSGRDHCLYYRLAEALAAATERERRVRALLPDWTQAVEGDERWLNSPRAHYTECQQLPAVIERARSMLGDLTAALDGPEGGAR